MEEQKKEELETTQEVPTEPEGSSSEKTAQKGLPTRSYVMMTLAGVYLVFAGYQLCRDVLLGKEGSSIGFLLAGVVFLGLGCGMLFVSIRNAMRKNKAKKEQEAAMVQTEAEEVKTAEAVPEPQDTREQRLSISQRARLVERLDEEETEE